MPLLAVTLFGFLLNSCVSDYMKYPGEDEMEQAESDPNADATDTTADDSVTPPDSDPTSEPPSDDPPPPDPNAGKVTYLADVEPIMRQLCVACHNDNLHEDGVNLDGYNRVKQAIDDVLESMMEDEDDDDIMPPSGRVDNAIIQTLLAWRTDGFLMGEETPPDDTDSGTNDVNYTYMADILPVFEDYCIMCHGANSPAGGFDMSTYQKTIDQIDPILARMELQTGQAGVMPPSGQLDAATLQKIRAWIALGMPE